MATYDKVIVVRSGDGDESSVAVSRSPRQFMVDSRCFSAILICMIPMTIVASVRAAPIAPKIMGTMVVSAVLDCRADSLIGSTLGPNSLQDTNVDDKFVDMPG